MVDSGRDRLLFVFSPALRCGTSTRCRSRSRARAWPTTACSCASCPNELFADRRTFAHDLFGAQEVEGYLGHLDTAIDRQLDELGDAGTFEVFALARRLGHRLALGCWMGDDAGDPAPTRPADRRASSSSTAPRPSCTPNGVAGSGPDRDAERAALARVEPKSVSCSPRARPTTGSSPRSRAGGTASTIRRGAPGVAGDVVLLHIATMTNLFAALGWTIALVLLHPDVEARLAATTTRSSSGACSSRSGSGSARS